MQPSYILEIQITRGRLDFLGWFCSESFCWCRVLNLWPSDPCSTSLSRPSFLIGFGHFHGSTQLYVSIAKFRIPYNKACQSIITTIVYELSLSLPRKRTPTGSWPSVSSSCLSKDSMPCATEKDRWGVPLIEKHYYCLVSDMTPWKEVLCRKSSRILS